MPALSLATIIGFAAGVTGIGTAEKVSSNRRRVFPTARTKVPVPLACAGGPRRRLRTLSTYEHSELAYVRGRISGQL